MRSTFKTLFYINRQKIKANGKCPIMGRITLDGMISQYSTGEEINPALWISKTGRVNLKGQNSSDVRILKAVNTKLDELEERAKLAYKKYTDETSFVSAEIIKNAVTGKAQAKETLLTLFDEHNEEYAKRVGIDRVRKTYIRYLTSRKHIQNFIRYKYSVEDVSLRSLTMQFINDFHFYLSTILKLKIVTLNDYLISLRKMGRLAVKQKTLKRDPFAGYRLEQAPIIHRHINSEQLEKIMSLELPTYRLCHTRDLFVFAVFTGIGRADLENLSWDNIINEPDGSTWIKYRRQKTKAECNIKLLDIPTLIINKYKGEGKDNKIFFVPKTCNLNRSLKMIANKYELDFHLTFYMARHTFATETCLSNGVPIETISKMMGHSNIRTTQIYAEITNQKIGKDLGLMSEQTKGLYSIAKNDMPSRIYQCGRYSGWKNESKTKTDK